MTRKKKKKKKAFGQSERHKPISSTKIDAKGGKIHYCTQRTTKNANLLVLPFTVAY